MNAWSTEYVTADAIGGLLDVVPGVAWGGPAEGYLTERREWIPVTIVGYDGARPGRVWAFACSDTMHDAITCSLGGLRLPTARPEVRSQIARVMAAGERCSTCVGGEVDVGNDVPSKCGRCNGTGYTRKPDPIWHLLPATESPTGLPPELAASSPGLIACSVARVAVGLGVVRGVLLPWHERRTGAYRSTVDGPDPDSPWEARVLRTPLQGGRAVSWQAVAGSGPEPGDAGKALADAAALAAGFALVNAAGTVVLPWPAETP